MAACGLCWAGVYLLVVFLQRRDRIPAIPLPAIAVNISWEFIYTFLLHPGGPLITATNAVWFFLDVVVSYQYCRYARPAQPWWGARMAVVGQYLLALAVAFPGVLLMAREFHDVAGKYSAFGDSLMMSILYCSLVLSRRSLAGQSLLVALLKGVGTLFASIAWLDDHNPLLPWLFISCAVFDAIYAVLLVKQARELGMSPWNLARGPHPSTLSSASAAQVRSSAAVV